MSEYSPQITTLILILLVAWYLNKTRQKRQLAFIENYQFHPAISDKLKKKYPQLTVDQVQMVFRGLRDYFYICNMANRLSVAMPSQVVDDAWHEFILFTRTYQRFCRKSLGRFLHHTPTEVMPSATMATEGIRRAWRLACYREKINPAAPKRLPLLFAIDSKLGIENGFTYHLNCRKQNSADGAGYCAGHIGCSSGCRGDSAGGDGLLGTTGTAECSGGCSGGCGGD